MSDQKSKSILFQNGYLTDRIERGDKREYRYPHSSLPNLPEGTSLEMESSIIETLREEGID